jgi:hypothetical protein
MKITRQQLRRLIESVLRETSGDDDDTLIDRPDTTFRFDDDDNRTFVGGELKSDASSGVPPDEDLGSAFDKPKPGRVGVYQAKTSQAKKDRAEYWAAIDKIRAGEHVPEIQQSFLDPEVPTYSKHQEAQGRNPLEAMYNDNSDLFDDYDPSEYLIDVGGDIDDPLS